MDQRVTELEIAVSHQQHLLDELNDVVLSQQKQLDELTRELQRLWQRIEQSDEEPA